MHSFSDEQLMECFQVNTDGLGSAAFDHLYARYAKRMVNYFYYVMQTGEEHAQDLLHDLFLRVIENRNKFNPGQSFKSWLYRIAANLCRNDFRSRAVHRKYRMYLQHSHDPVCDAMEPEDHFLHQCFQKLKHDQRTVTVMRFKLDLTIREIAEITGCPEGTVKSRLYYATRELNKMLNKG